MSNSKTIPTKQTIKEAYLFNKIAKAKKNQIKAETFIFSLVIVAGAIFTTLF